MHAPPMYRRIPVRVFTHCADCGNGYWSDKGHDCNAEPFSSELWKKTMVLKGREQHVIFNKVFPNPE